MHNFKVPTVPLAAEIQCADGTVLRGTVFLAADSAVQAGPMLPDEWINGPTAFFPFLQTRTESAILVNKSNVLAFSVAAAPDDESDEGPVVGLPVQRVVVEAGNSRFEGGVVIDMPDHQRRLVDYLNRPDPFLPLRAGARLHFVRKDCISRVTEISES
jgi:hypothetical protein